MTFNGKKIKGILLDITGVLTESVSGGGSRPVAGSVEAVNRIKATRLPVSLSLSHPQSGRH